MKKIHLLLLVASLSVVAGFNGTECSASSQPRRHNTRVVFRNRPQVVNYTIVRPLARKQVNQLMTNLGDVKRNLADLRQRHLDTVRSFDLMTGELQTLQEQMHLAQTLLLGAFAVLLVAVLPAFKNSLASQLALQTLGRRQIETDQYSSVDKWLQDFSKPSYGATPRSNSHSELQKLKRRKASNVTATTAVSIGKSLENESLDVNVVSVAQPELTCKPPATDTSTRIDKEQQSAIIVPATAASAELAPAPRVEFQLPPNGSLNSSANVDGNGRQNPVAFVPVWMNNGLEWEMNEHDWDLNMLMSEVETKRNSTDNSKPEEA